MERAFRPPCIRLCWALAAAFAVVLCVPARAQFGFEEPAGLGLSKQMQLAIHLYQQGRDTEAMDRFMDVLVNGEPRERTMANDYLNLITQRQNVIGGELASGAKNNLPQPEVVPVRPLRRDPVGVPSGRLSTPSPSLESERDPEQLARSNKAVMKREIDNAVRAKARLFLSELEKLEEIRVIMADGRNPRAIGIPTEFFFENGTIFKKTSASILKNLSGLVYCLGATQVAILPEGVMLGDSKILDMRRTMAISSYFSSAGIAPPRIRVNLLQSQVDLPRGLADFRGIILLFIYNQPLTLSAERLIGEESGPPISLGIFPERVSAERNEGSIIEFSVVEPPVGLSSWKFHILPPGKRGAEAAPIQEVMGGAPVFHQIYWNGKRNYFGSALPSGSYEVVVTATDAKGRTRSLHKWIALQGAAPAEEPTAVASRPAPASSSPARASRGGGDDGPLEVGARTGSSGLRAGVPVSDLPGSGRKKPAYVQLVKRTPAASEKRASAKKSAKKKPAGKSKKGKGVKAAKKPTPEVEAQEPELPEQALRKEPIAQPNPIPQAPPTMPAPQPEQPAPKTQPAQQATSMSYQVWFAQNTENMTQKGDQAVQQVADTMTYYPQVNLNLIGYASRSETDAQALAEKRASQVSSLLVNKHNVDSRRIQIQSKVTDDAKRHDVEIFIVAGKD
ncbi:MAG: OmpA family protein [Elusimicrobia bacterium]|nr:OmpA family protein [Elusimicrobiota bacterium]